jgi:CheY-like chemotaxis protein
MMNSLLLYNNNISPDFVKDFQDSIGETKYFSITNQTLAKEDYSFDSVASEFLTTLSDKKYDVIFIPVNLSTDNYLEFSGLRIGYHIRLTNEFNNQETPIVFIARESAFEINKLSFLGEILSCPQIYMTDKLEIDVFKKQIEFIQSTSKENVLKGFLDRIHIKPSGNYTTHHSIANEWSIMRWFKTIIKSEIIDYTPDEIETIDSKINSNLYYKYLTCKFPINNVQDLTIEDLKLKFNGKILYIDDEKDKGWNELFCALFYDNVINKVEDYESLGSEFHELEREEIINLSVNKAKDFDLVILDFRLTEDDFYESDPKKITGYKILEGIKAHNKGIQVVIFSATNKVWNLQALQDAGADGFIVKESPENSLDSHFTVESLKNVTSIIDNCFKYKFLKDIFRSQKSLVIDLVDRKNYKKRTDFLPKEFVDEVLKWLQIANNNLAVNKTEAGITTSFILYFSLIENIANRLIDVDNPIEIRKQGMQSKFEFEFRTSTTKLSVFIEDRRNPGKYRKLNEIFKSNNRGIPWTQKILNTLDHICCSIMDQETINRLIAKRNDLIHANITTGERIEIQIQDIEDVFKIINEGLTNIK